MTTVRLVQENITRECDTQEPIGPSKISGEEVLNRPSAEGDGSSCHGRCSTR
uniref:Uncharacterized protein n=1 Tax=Hyaloperonospora arabidopsidis (strain Emoy2) TaxID=559515 RepID=M4BRD6_HYAAE